MLLSTLLVSIFFTLFVIVVFLLIAFIVSFENRLKVIRSSSVLPEKQVDGNLVSVIVPAFNEENYLPNCLKSIKNQTYRNIEIIVADNGSTDRTRKISLELGAKILDVKDKNLSKVRNEGARMAKGDILFFLDADSIIENCYIEKMIKQLSEKRIFSHGGICCYDSKLHNFLWIFNRWFKPRFYTSGRNGVCIWKKNFWEIGGYDEKINPLNGEGREDLDLGLRVLRKFGFFSIKYCPYVLIGSSARREKIFGYPFWKFPDAWQKGVRGVRNKKVLY